MKATWCGGVRWPAVPLGKGVEPKFSRIIPLAPPLASASASARAHASTPSKPPPS